MLKCVLLDANIIIEAYHLGIWEKLIEKVEISVSSIVAHTESLFYVHKDKHIPEAINLKNLISKGKITEYSAPYEDLAGLSKAIRRHFTEKFFKENLRQGSQNRITQTGLRKK